MSSITPEFLFSTFKKSFLEESEEYAESAIPTSLLFEFSDEKILVYHSLEAELISEENIKESSECLEYLDSGIELKLEYSYDDINFNKLAKDFNSFAPKIGFPLTSHIKDDENHLFWLGYYRKDISIETSADIEAYCLSEITSTFNQLQHNYFEKIYVTKQGDSVVFNEKINSLTPYWGDEGLDCFYINSPKDSTDLNDGIMLTSHFNISETDYLETWMEKEEDDYSLKYNHYHELLFILYRVCAKLKKEFSSHPLFESDFECYPCSHDTSEELNKTYMRLAEENLNLNIKKYLKICEDVFKKS